MTPNPRIERAVHGKPWTALLVVILPLLIGCGAENGSAFEAKQTEKLLGVAVQDFPPPQGLAGFDELPASAPEFRFTVAERPLSGAPPQAFHEVRPSMQARGPDGSVYEAYLGKNDAGYSFVSTLANRRQRYRGHYGYEYSPPDVFVGRHEGGKLKPILFFRDVGSHTGAPYYLAVDNRGRCHLTVADVNIDQGNRLDLYWVIGNPMSGRWTAAWLIDRRGFTSWSHPWSAAWGEKVHLLWTWGDGRVDTAPGSGAFHVEWSRGKFTRKVRLISGLVNQLAAAVDPRSGRLLVVFSKDDGVYVLSRPEGGSWTRAAWLHPEGDDVAVEAAESGEFIIRTGSEGTREWVLRPGRTVGDAD